MSGIDDYKKSRNWRLHPFYSDEMAVTPEVAEAHLRDNPDYFKKVVDERGVRWCFDYHYGISQYETLMPHLIGGPGGPTIKWMDAHPVIAVDRLPDGRYWIFKEIVRWPNA